MKKLLMGLLMLVAGSAFGSTRVVAGADWQCTALDKIRDGDIGTLTIYHMTHQKVWPEFEVPALSNPRLIAGRALIGTSGYLFEGAMNTPEDINRTPAYPEKDKTLLVMWNTFSLAYRVLRINPHTGSAIYELHGKVARPYEQVSDKIRKVNMNCDFIKRKI